MQRGSPMASNPASPLRQMPAGLDPDRKHMVLACRTCECALVGSDDIIKEQTDVWSKAVYSYELDVLNVEDVACYSATNPGEVRFDVARIHPVAIPAARRRDVLKPTRLQSGSSVEEEEEDEEDEWTTASDEEGEDMEEEPQSEEPSADVKSSTERSASRSKSAARQPRVVFPGPCAAETTPSATVGRSIVLEGPYSPQHSWFPGYSWCFAKCGKCNDHLGWGFAKDADIAKAKARVREQEDAYNEEHVWPQLAQCTIAEKEKESPRTPDTPTPTPTLAKDQSSTTQGDDVDAPKEDKPAASDEAGSTTDKNMTESELMAGLPLIPEAVLEETFPVAFVGLIVTKTRERELTKAEIAASKAAFQPTTAQRTQLRLMLQHMFGGELDDPTVLRLIGSEDELPTPGTDEETVDEDDEVAADDAVQEDPADED